IAAGKGSTYSFAWECNSTQVRNNYKVEKEKILMECFLLFIATLLVLAAVLVQRVLRLGCDCQICSAEVAPLKLQSVAARKNNLFWRFSMSYKRNYLFVATFA